ncbi:hypothetical protein TVAG_232130 [Trichomonas vaginalis G3]|uniref:Uncharacterized protein n=1 Tax=Trichomonas vaginalis (strain ATCC PRA-98 / G3) TaxID=412133 RepID=A2G2R7_TRIV3|nr:hypothetical protein TVAGG3_0567720 [Trichomonas vaginalis G3]EAX88545.1 hypothetical protein TVAG_232130 [Trichomonas vaginalis G3]KAI5521695.1 hypothetical protein TVAGG3_0567720 [Trichomonas vaginalis G3]|eukprot:XP_001301475.1 hypothetical protein [Trichomonas vaginalis G3]
MITKIGKCKFISDNQSFCLLFIDSARNQNRFLYSLADAGLIVPIDLQTYAIIEKPSNIPNGKFTNLEMSVTQTIHSIFRNRFMNLTEEQLPDHFQDYNGYAAAFFVSLLQIKVKKWIKESESNISISPDFDTNRATEWLLSKTQENSNNYAEAHKKIKDANPNQSKLIKVVNNDAVRHRTEDKQWTDILNRTCIEVLSSMIAEGHSYLQGEYDISAKIALTLGSSGNSETIYNATKYICEFLKLEDRAGASTIQLISDEIFNIYEKACPEIFKFFKNRGWDIFIVLGNVIPPIFTRSFDDVWKLWYWLEQKNEKNNYAFSCFCGAVMLMMIPEISSHKTLKVDYMLEYWDTSLPKLDLNSLLDISNYLYHNSLN